MKILICIFICIQSAFCEGVKPFIKSSYTYNNKKVIPWIIDGLDYLNYEENMPDERVSSFEVIKKSNEYLMKTFGKGFQIRSFAFRRIPSSSKQFAWCWKVAYLYPKKDRPMYGNNLMVVHLSHKGQILMKEVRVALEPRNKLDK